MKKLALTLLFIFSFINNIYGNIDAVYKTVCLVSTSNGKGSGNIVKITNNKLYIITAAHVLSDTPTFNGKLEVEFFHNGFNSEKIIAKLEYMKHNIEVLEDFAIISIEKENLKEYPLPDSLILNKDYKYNNNEIVFSVGCARGGWPTGWIGHVKRIDDNAVYVVPKPVQGRSGSAVVDDMQLVGIILRIDGASLRINRIAEIIMKEDERLYQLLFN